MAFNNNFDTNNMMLQDATAPIESPDTTIPHTFNNFEETEMQLRDWGVPELIPIFRSMY